MNPDLPPPRLRSRAWWLGPAFLALLVVPASWVTIGLIAALGIRYGLRAYRHLAVRRHAHRSLAGELDQATAVVLGTDGAGRVVKLSDSQLAAHGLILGASGAGKSTTLLSILTAQIRRGNPVVAIDLKGSPAFAHALGEAAAGSGRPFRCWSPDGPELWNPLAHGNATELKDKLISTERFTEPHYQRAAERYVQTALQVLQARGDREVTLARVVEALEPVRLAALARALPRERASQVSDYMASLTPDQLSAVRGLAARLAIISESHTGRYLAGGSDGIDLRAALAGGEVVLFSLNSSTYGRLSAQLGTLAVQDLVSAAGDRLRSGAAAAAAASATVGIDEFSALGSDNVIALLARGREAGVSVLLATQELADLDRAARGLRDQVLGNTAVKIAHRQDVPRSAETVAQLAGTVRGWERSYSVRRSGRWGGERVEQGSLRQVDRYVVEPDRVRSLQTGEAVVIVKTPVSRAQVTRVVRPAARAHDERGVER
ncbi:MAG TPA: TraM recognition domain-containing protein [Solirubrobacteraceae bacterium]|nr:TraM recognition domain-containing protein [Solirubrobacteraceae bacterium]